MSQVRIPADITQPEAQKFYIDTMSRFDTYTHNPFAEPMDAPARIKTEGEAHHYAKVIQMLHEPLSPEQRREAEK